MSSELLMAMEAARESRVHYRTFLTWIYDGVIPAHKVGRRWRVKRDDLDSLLGGTL